MIDDNDSNKFYPNLSLNHQNALPFGGIGSFKIKIWCEGKKERGERNSPAYQILARQQFRIF